MTKMQTVLFSILHGCAALLLPLLLFLLGGCLEPDLVNKPGPEVPCAEIESALKAALPGPWTFDVGQFVQIETTIAPTGQPPSVAGEMTQLVLSSAPSSSDPSATVLNLEVTTYQNGTNNTSEGQITAPSVILTCPDPSQQVGSFHNFKTADATLPAPFNTNGTCDSRYKNCLINAKRFDFDLLVPSSDGTTSSHYSITVSGEVPYLARQLEFCETRTVDANGQKIPVTQCDDVRNFLFKSN
jgi:hypothetical protein